MSKMSTYGRLFFQRLCGMDCNWSCRKTEFWENLGPEFWNLVQFLLQQLVFQILLCSKNSIFLPENWVLNKNLGVLAKILAEFWIFGSFWPAEFWRKCWKKAWLIGFCNFDESTLRAKFSLTWYPIKHCESGVWQRMTAENPMCLLWCVLSVCENCLLNI